MSQTLVQRFLDPDVLAGISSLDLVAKTVVEGFLAGLHRSPDFGFSQEFAEYRAYAPGDDLRTVDWNVFARTERLYLKRFRGETNTQITLLLDVSRSMSFGSGRVNKLEYAKFLAAAIAYLTHLQRDSTGLIVFHEQVSNFLPPSTRQGQLMRLLHGIESARTGGRTDFSRPFHDLQGFLKRRGISILISDLLDSPERIIRAAEPLRYRGSEVILFHVLDPQEVAPQLAGPTLLVDLETGDSVESTADYARGEYRNKIAEHLGRLQDLARAAGIGYFLAVSNRPLDQVLREYLAVRQRRA